MTRMDRVILLRLGSRIALTVLVVFGIESGRSIYFEIALIIALLGFVATVALAKFLMRGEVIE